MDKTIYVDNTSKLLSLSLAFIVILFNCMCTYHIDEIIILFSEARALLMAGALSLQKVTDAVVTVPWKQMIHACNRETEHVYESIKQSIYKMKYIYNLIHCLYMY